MSKSVSETFNCQICDLNRWRRTFGETATRPRSCFYFEPEIECTVVRLGPDNLPVVRETPTNDQLYEMETRVFTRESLIQYVLRMEQIFPDEPPIWPFKDRGIIPLTGVYNIEQMDGICPRSLEDPQLYPLIRAEGQCSRYHCLPYAGALENQPRRVMDAFEIINGVKNEFQLAKAEADAEREKARQATMGS